MQQILQNLKTGTTELVNVPCPSVASGQVLIGTRVSLISAGTERMLMEFGHANLLEKARSQPDRMRQVLDKVRTDGLVPTLEAVRHKLGQPLALGYCNAGVVLEIGRGVDGFAVGDRVASNGSHAEVVCVPHTLCTRIPDAVGDAEAALCRGPPPCRIVEALHSRCICLYSIKLLESNAGHEPRALARRPHALSRRRAALAGPLRGLLR
jgi:threonine dehydrogenase-like Zn-dependent dehydrogenase